MDSEANVLILSFLADTEIISDSLLTYLSWNQGAWHFCFANYALLAFTHGFSIKIRHLLLFVLILYVISMGTNV